MIVNLRGTSGSGKSHIIRQIMEALGGKDSFLKQKSPDRKQPLGYFKHYSTADDAPAALYVPGHYETACGGCDTLTKGSDVTFGLIKAACKEGYHVLFEGLILSVEFNRTLALAQEYPVKVFAIEIPLEECLASINVRRRIKNPEAPDVNPMNTTNKWLQTKRAIERLKGAGVDARLGNREEVLGWTKEAFGVH